MTSKHPLYERERPQAACWNPAPGLIWMAGESLFYENPRNRYMRFRKTFELPFQPVTMELAVWADTHYQLHVNGNFLGRGPGRSDPAWTLYDVYREANILRRGYNTIALLALFQGFGTGSRISLMQALLFRLEVTGGAGEKLVIQGDRSWKASPAPEFVRPTPRLHGPLGCMEVQDQRLAEVNWTQPGFDDNSWAGTDFIKPDLEVSPWYYFSENPLPRRREGWVHFHAEAQAGTASLPPVEVSCLGEKRPAPEGMEAACLPVTVEPRGQARVINLELDRIECGLPQIDIEGAAGTIIDALFAESLVNGMVPYPGSARVLTGRWILREGRQTLETAFNWLAFRYLQLWVWSDEPVTIHAAGLKTLYYPLPGVAGFTCSDPDLSRLDSICAHTVQLCYQDAIVDSPSREQQQWIGDARKTAVFNHARWGDAGLHRQLIEQIGQGMDWMGSLVPRYPSGNRNVTPIPSYILDWVMAFEEYRWFTARDDLLPKWWPNLLLAMRWFSAFENASGLLENVPHWKYIDMGADGRNMAEGKILTTLNLQYLAACKAMENYAGRLHDASSRDWFAEKSRILAASIRKLLWAGKGYADACSDGHLTEGLSEVTSAHALLYLEGPGTYRARRILETAFGPSAQAVRTSPFSMHTVLSALTGQGRPDLALALIRERYQRHLDEGATATWEHWEVRGYAPDGYPRVGSECHAWGAAPLFFFTNTLLGLRPVAPGWTKAEIAPWMGNLSWACGECQTPIGKFRIAWERSDNSFQLELDVPSQAKGTVCLPDGSISSIQQKRHICNLPDIPL